MTGAHNAELVGNVPASRPPGPSGLPFVGAVKHMRGDVLRNLTGLVERYGGVVSLGQLMGLPAYLLADSSAIKHVLQDNQKNYRKGRGTKRMRGVLGNGLLLLEGDPWRRHRRMVQPAFHRGRIAQIGDTVVRTTDELIERWRLERPERIDVRDEMLKLTMQLTFRNLFHADSAELAELVDAWLVLFEMLSKARFALVRVPAWVPTAENRRNQQARATIARVLDRLIDSKRANDDGSLLAMLVHARDEDGSVLSPNELRDEVMTIFVGGYETSATALSFALAVLAADSETESKHLAELTSVLGGAAPGMQHLSQLPFNKMVIEETMRMYPPSWVITREAIEDDVVDGFAIPAGAQLLISAYATHHNPKFWPSPSTFDPQRFSPSFSDRPKLAYLPFGGGPRMCLGEQYALTSMQLILARLHQRCVFTSAVPGMPKAKAGIGLEPATAIHLSVAFRALNATAPAPLEPQEIR